MNAKKYNLIVILGPTASGKTTLAVKLAREIGGEILSADSRQVYRGLNLGTGKDLHEYTLRGEIIPYHLIDIVDPDHEFNVFEYQKRFYDSFREVGRRKAFPVLVGGTGLYIEAVTREYEMVEVPINRGLRIELENETMPYLQQRLLASNPHVHNITDFTDKKRLIRAIEIAECSKQVKLPVRPKKPEIVPFVVGVRHERDVLRRKIRKRLQERMEQGLIEEVQALKDRGLSWEKLDYFGLEYRYVSSYLQGKINFEEMFSLLNTRIGQFAKRQLTWFRRMERKGTVIHWIDNADYVSLRNLLRKESANFEHAAMLSKQEAFV